MTGPVVVPVLPTYLDPERVTHCAVPYGRAIANRIESELVLLSVVEISESLRSYLDAEGKQVERMIQHWLEQRREAIDRLAEAVNGVSVRVEVRAGEPVREIVAFTTEQQAAVVVMSSHSRPGLARLFVGSVAFSVVQRAQGPVLVVRAQIPVPAPNAPVTLAPVLVPLDGSSLAEEAIDSVLMLFGQGRDALDLHLFHVLRGDTEPAKWERYLEGVARRVQERGARVTWSLGSGAVADAIAHEAEQRHAGLIAMATHGVSGVRRVLLGSTAEHVLHTTTVPLLLYRPHAVRQLAGAQPRRTQPLRVRDVMTPNPIVVGPEATLERVAEVMLKHQIGALPVVDSDGRLLGLIREEDFLAQERLIPFSVLRAPHLFGRWVTPERLEEVYAEVRQLEAREVARPPEITASEDMTLGELAARMVAADVRHVPVVHEGKLVGIVTRHDILKAVARSREHSG